METLYDSRGYQIHPGDVLKVFHYVAAVRRERRYMYKLVIEKDGALLGVCVGDIANKGLEGAHSYRLIFNARSGYLRDTEIVEGYGPGELNCYRDRPRDGGQSKLQKAVLDAGCGHYDAKTGEFLMGVK